MSPTQRYIMKLVIELLLSLAPAFVIGMIGYGINENLGYAAGLIMFIMEIHHLRYSEDSIELSEEEIAEVLKEAKRDDNDRGPDGFS